jgi:glycosyltransferase involved in cell wall biosynthesis
MTRAGDGREPLVSVVLPTLNGRRFIRSAIESCLAQTYERFELIVVDGGSTDATPDLVRAIGDPRIRLVVQPDNADRLPGALNRGFAEARGEYYTWMQDDDLYAPEALAILVAGLEEHRSAGMVYGGMVFIDADGEELRPANHFPPEALAWTNPIGHCFMYRRAVARAVGPYDPRFVMAEDAHYWLRISRHAEIVRLPGRYFAHRLHEGSLTGRDYGAYVALRVAARARREVLGLSSREYRRQVAAAFVEEAFAAYERDELAHVRGSLVRAALRRPQSVARCAVALLCVRSLARTAASPG